MKNFDKNLTDIKTNLEVAARSTENEIKKLFPKQLSYDILTGQKRYITHDFDPPWDSSGNLFSKSIDANFDINDYDKVGDYFEEYTGNSQASFISGHGLYFETYGEYYREWIEDNYRDAHYDVFQEIDIEVLMAVASRVLTKDTIYLLDKVDLINELTQVMDEFQDHSWGHAENLILEISEMDISFVYKLGEKQAKEQLHKEKIEIENKRKEIEKEKVAFNKIWSILEKKYRLANKKPFPKRIEMPDFKSFKHFLDEHKVPEHERVWISKYAPISFSNSVSFKLESKLKS